jgi:GDPmannose 4,6-dehydratase
MKKRALITGITGMDGSYLADFLLEKEYEVFGIERRTSGRNLTNIEHLIDKIEIFAADLTDQSSLLRVLFQCRPDEVYNLASQSFVKASFNIPEQTGNVTGLGVLRMLEAIREYDRMHPYGKQVRFYQASSSEMFGKVQEVPQTETTPFYPRSPYGVAKLYGHWITKNYREAYNMYNVCGILFNHESERRGIEFVTRKISDGVARIKLGFEDYITLGNLDAKRDWGYAPDYVEAMWLMLQQDNPDDYVIATGESHSIRDFLNIAFAHIGIKNWKSHIKQDKRFMRPAEVDYLIGDSSKARNELDWNPKTSFEELVIKMVNNDLKILGKVEKKLYI